MIIIINGAPGSGKSKTAELLSKSLPKSAWVDGDWMLRSNLSDPEEKLRLFRYQNIANLTKSYINIGCDFVIISFVYVGPIGLSDQINLLKTLDKIIVFNLITNEKSLRERHNNDSYEREDIEESIKLNERIRKIEGVEMIDNSEKTIEETIQIIINRAIK